MRWLALFVAVGCSSATDCPDCGPTLSVTVRYFLDGGTPLDDDAGCAPLVVCEVTKHLAAQEYYYTVLPSLPATGCHPFEPSATQRIIDCITLPGAQPPKCFFTQGICLCGSRPPGAFSAACDWVPPPPK